MGEQNRSKIAIKIGKRSVPKIRSLGFQKPFKKMFEQIKKIERNKNRSERALGSLGQKEDHTQTSRGENELKIGSFQLARCPQNAWDNLEKNPTLLNFFLGRI